MGKSTVQKSYCAIRIPPLAWLVEYHSKSTCSMDSDGAQKNIVGALIDAIWDGRTYLHCGFRSYMCFHFLPIPAEELQRFNKPLMLIISPVFSRLGHCIRLSGLLSLIHLHRLKVAASSTTRFIVFLYPTKYRTSLSRGWPRENLSMLLLRSLEYLEKLFAQVAWMFLLSNRTSSSFYLPWCVLGKENWVGAPTFPD